MPDEDKQNRFTDAKTGELNESRVDILKNQISEAKKEITDIKARIKNQRGPGAGKKQKDMQERISFLKDKILEWEENLAEVSEKDSEKDEDDQDETDGGEVISEFIPSGWQKASEIEVKKAETEGRLIGWDHDRGIAKFK